ncbi:hypothetical protein [Thioflexithrix psekupsensis]|uniref:Uncharacterized protein n=1 Tax=Thioflexithrix psekupsensis TaxID=1570016 RepID=A0A251X4Y6_9GAMM|nr:hypothetical protein [Thioflexithrix psekupsensis]OUD12491.1 hypothetical protein TPSD3_15445 [Thioflexithrix psekupsensis]
MFEERTRLIIEEKYIELVAIVVAKLREMPVNAVLDSIEPRHTTVWEAFAAQFGINRDDDEDEDMYEIYGEVVAGVCEDTVEQQLTLTELQLLWLVSEAASIWEEDEFPDEVQMLSEVAEELLSWVEQEAEEPELIEEMDSIQRH